MAAMATEKNEAIDLVRVFIEALDSLPSSGSYEGPDPRRSSLGSTIFPPVKFPKPADALQNASKNRTEPENREDVPDDPSLA
jgi:hypothetical protein